MPFVSLPGSRKPDSAPCTQAGRDVFSNLDRDERILQSVTRVVQRGFAPTRSHVSKDKGQVHSACSIVAATLHQLGINIAENAIEAIWRKRNKKGWDTVISEWTVRKK